jgi:hypothetical protein
MPWFLAAKFHVDKSQFECNNLLLVTLKKNHWYT